MILYKILVFDVLGDWVTSFSSSLVLIILIHVIFIILGTEIVRVSLDKIDIKSSSKFLIKKELWNFSF